MGVTNQYKSHLNYEGWLAMRLWSNTTQDKNGCIIWLGTKSLGGYGRIGLPESYSSKKRWVLTHRLAYTLVVGEIPKGLTIDHLCRNRACCNPAHLEAVSMKVNNLRGHSATAVNARKEECLRGHKFTEENTYRYKNGRICKVCRRMYQFNHKMKKAGLNVSK